MEPRIEYLPVKHFIGKSISMSFAENKTAELWHSFMPKRRELQNVIGTELYSIEQYPSGFFNNFNAKAIFNKWAAVEVGGLDEVPDGMEALTSPEGLYAVFIHKGPASEGPKTYQHIFGVWLPQSGYMLDERPHFAVMGDKYRNDSADSEEELWIPVKAQ